jgi:hypothetical protein
VISEVKVTQTIHPDDDDDDDDNGGGKICDAANPATAVG